jgi:hypothetical protein
MNLSGSSLRLPNGTVPNRDTLWMFISVARSTLVIHTPCDLSGRWNHSILKPG